MEAVKVVNQAVQEEAMDTERVYDGTITIWTPEEVQQLAHMRLRDRATWPQRLLDKRTKYLSEPASWEGSCFNFVFFRTLLLREAVKESIADSFVYAEALAEALYQMTDRHSDSWHLLNGILETIWDVASAAIDACMKYVPELDKVFPHEDPRQILAAMGITRAIPTEGCPADEFELEVESES